MRAKGQTKKNNKPAVSHHGVYGSPPTELVEVPVDAIQFSPLMPGASELELGSEDTLTSMTMLAPPGALERRYALALSLRALVLGGSFIALAPNNRGGTRLDKELQAFGCIVQESARRHHRILSCARPAKVEGLDKALSDGASQIVAGLDLWSQPGVFSWDRIDPGTALLLQHLPSFSGRGADLGCGVGILSRTVLASARVEQITLIDIDRRAIKAAQQNVTDPRARFDWADVRDPNVKLSSLDFVVMNAPFHGGGSEDRTLALGFVKRAAEALRDDGVCWLVANRHLPYEAVLKPLFKRADLKIETGGYKIYEARK